MLQWKIYRYKFKKITYRYMFLTVPTLTLLVMFVHILPSDSYSENWWAGGGGFSHSRSHLYINQEVGGGGGWVVGDLSHSVAVGLSSRQYCRLVILACTFVQFVLFNKTDKSLQKQQLNNFSIFFKFWSGSCVQNIYKKVVWLTKKLDFI